MCTYPNQKQQLIDPGFQMRTWHYQVYNHCVQGYDPMSLGGLI